MITPQQIQQAKAVSILQYLGWLGHKPVQKTGQEFAYRSPKTGERTASLFVNEAKNVFCDYSADERGDVIRLVQYLQGCGFVSAVEQLRRFAQLTDLEAMPLFSFSGPSSLSNEPIPDEKKLYVNGIGPLSHPALISYVESRCIALALGQRYLRQVHYRVKGKNYFAAGFGNDAGGYELRSTHFKGSSAPKGITSVPGTVPGGGTGEIWLFEGFFDFLSALSHLGLSRPTHTTIVLNSTVNLSQARPHLLSALRIVCFLDDDRAGTGLLTRLRGEGLPVEDRSSLYQGYKDYNDFLMHQPHFPVTR